MQGIYIIKCLVNNKVYVGQTVNFKARVNAHRCALRKGYGVQKLQEDWDTYSESDFEFEFIEECKDRQLRNERERYYIQLYQATTLGYNTSAGGIGQGNFKYLNGMYGRKHSEESKALMSKNRKGLTAGKNNPNYGNHDNSRFTEDVRKRMSESQKKRWQLKKGQC